MAKAPDAPQFPMAFDMTKLMGSFDPSNLMGEYSKMMQQMKLPGIDVSKLLETQKKNVEALTQANRVAFEGFQVLAKRQAEILQETMKEASKSMEMFTGSPQEIAAKQAEFARDAMQKGLANMRELAEILTKSTKEAADTINARITATLAEVRDMATTLK